MVCLALRATIDPAILPPVGRFGADNTEKEARRAPATIPDGAATGLGVWHGRFSWRSADGMLIDSNGHLWPSDSAVPASVKIVGRVGSEDRESV
ncbi:hypothetical protein R70006_06306 [Paraburkholderia domus]|nr:hypothetical protein R70006_06306 [Paraburkholderia domus]